LTAIAPRRVREDELREAIAEKGQRVAALAIEFGDVISAEEFRAL
jgi:hypothetical protein